MAKQYIAFDPGKTTGSILASVRDYREFVILHAEDITWGSFLSSLANQLVSCDPQVIIVEDFRMYASAAEHLIHNDFPAVKTIGRIEGVASILLPEVKIVLQMPSIRKSVRILDEHKESLVGTHHAKDAYKHLRYYLIRNRVDHSS